MSTNLTPHFTLEELTATKTGLSNIPNENDIDQLRLLCRDILEPLRDRIGSPIIINSAFRSAAVNRAVGGVSNSQHLLGQAADIHTELHDDLYLWTVIQNMVCKGLLNVGQCIWYKKSNFVHVSLPCAKHNNQFLIRNK